jgi:hypothetical protein
VYRRLPAGIPLLRPQVPPVYVYHGLQNNHPDPYKGRPLLSRDEMLDALRGTEIRFLQNVILVHPVGKPAVETEMDHPPEALSVAGKQLRKFVGVHGTLKREKGRAVYRFCVIFDLQ